MLLNVLPSVYWDLYMKSTVLFHVMVFESFALFGLWYSTSFLRSRTIDFVKKRWGPCWNRTRYCSWCCHKQRGSWLIDDNKFLFFICVVLDSSHKFCVCIFFIKRCHQFVWINCNFYCVVMFSLCFLGFQQGTTYLVVFLE
jgi:hypothetical protein